ncbi:MAG: sensor histidine kinase [Longimicrobiaceae bacterium]
MSPSPGRHALLRRAAVLAAVAVISIADGLTPTGVVVGILLCIPIVLASMDPRPVAVVATGAVSAVGYVVAAIVGMGPISPPSVWIPNRVFAALSIPAATAVALLLQRSRIEAERARDEARAASELNRLLASLLAHDLRAPLVLAADCLRYVRDAAARGEVPDDALVAETHARLGRSLRAVEGVLALARGAPSGGEAARAAPVGPALAEEAAEFEAEARARGKRIVLDLGGVRDGPAADARVLRQVVATLLDNALRYAAPGDVTLSADTDHAGVSVRVTDPGPADAAEPGGAGVGLRLAAALAAHAGGTLSQDTAASGTRWVLRLPRTQTP